jgi:hypothetical protein
MDILRMDLRIGIPRIDILRKDMVLLTPVVLDASEA